MFVLLLLKFACLTSLLTWLGALELLFACLMDDKEGIAELFLLTSLLILLFTLGPAWLEWFSSSKELFMLLTRSATASGCLLAAVLTENCRLTGLGAWFKANSGGSEANSADSRSCRTFLTLFKLCLVFRNSSKFVDLVVFKLAWCLVRPIEPKSLTK